MGLRVPEGMADMEDMKKVVLEEENAPESWELVDLEENMKKLMSSARSSSCAPVVRDECIENEGMGIGGLPYSTDLDSTSANQVDGFLREALQNPRDRLTILRLEQDVERFIRNPSMQILEFQPMPSSYLRLAAHRVAQHYYLQSMVVDSGSTEGTRIVARKTSETRFPSLRLVDLPVEDHHEDKNVVAPMMPMKVAIKQRPRRGGHDNGDGLSAYGSKLNPSKSVEERKEEYNKARARIFCNELGGKSGDDESDFENSSSGESSGPSPARLEGKRKVEEALQDSPSKSAIDFPSAVKSLAMKPEKEKDVLMGPKLISATSFSSSNGNGGSRVAIFRDREKDRRDPDYDRNTTRYAQRFDPGFGVNVGHFGVQALYAPMLNYNTEFPQLGVPSRAQLQHMEPPPPPPIPSQHMGAPWVPPVNPVGYRASDPTLMGPYNPANMTAMAMYMHAPQYGYPGHAMTYLHRPDHFQQSISQQPHSQQQPDPSLNQVHRR